MTIKKNYRSKKKEIKINKPKKFSPTTKITNNKAKKIKYNQSILPKKKNNLAL